MTPTNSRPKACVICGTVFMAPASKWEKRKYCSRTCNGHGSIERLNTTRRSPKTYADKLSAANKGKRTGPDNSWYVAPIARVCIQCGTTFHRKPWQLRNGHTGMYCSVKCRGEHRRAALSGENSPFWVGGIKTYRGRDWQRVRVVVVERQDGRCATCDKHVGKSLPVHHVKPYREWTSAEEANDPANLIGLCQSCHMKQEPRPRR